MRFGQAESHRRTGFRARTVATGRNAGSAAVSSRAHGPAVVQATSAQKAVTYLINCTMFTQKLKITPPKTKRGANLWSYSNAEATGWRDASYGEEFSKRLQEHDPSLLAFLLSRRPSGIRDAPKYLDHYLIDGINDFDNCPRPIAPAALRGDTLAAQTRALEETAGKKKDWTKSFVVKILLQISENSATRLRYREHLEPRGGDCRRGCRCDRQRARHGSQSAVRRRRGPRRGGRRELRPDQGREHSWWARQIQSVDRASSLEENEEGEFNKMSSQELRPRSSSISRRRRGRGTANASTRRARTTTMRCCTSRPCACATSTTRLFAQKLLLTTLTNEWLRASFHRQ